MATDLIFQGLYTPPSGNAVDFNFNPSSIGNAEAGCTFITGQVGITGTATCSIPVSPADLIFQGLYTPPSGNAVELNFNPTPAGYTEYAEAGCAFTTDQVIIAGSVAFIPNVYLTSAAFTLSDVGISGESHFEAGVFRGIEASRSGVDNAGRNAYLQTTGQFLQGTHHYSELESAMEPADLLYSESRFGWTDVPHQHKPASLAWAIGKPLAQQRQADYSAAPAKHLNRFTVWGQAEPLQAQRSSAYIAPAAKPKAWLYRYCEGSTRLLAWSSLYGIATDTNRLESSLWDQGTPHSWLWGGWHYPPLPPPTPYTASPNLAFYQLEPDFIGGAVLVFGRPCYAWPLSNTRITISTGATIVLHTINVKRTSDNVGIPVLSATLKFDVDSWAWGVTLNLKTPETMALLESVNGEPREIQIELDGIYITALIEEWGETRVFGEHTYTASGRSSLALFAYPYAPLRSYLEADEKTAAQLIDHELLNTGWSAAYHANLVQLFTTDWLIPGGAWSYQNKAPIDAVVQIARTVGARAYADRNAKLVHIAPRYPINPWDWNAATLDQTIPLSLVRSLSTQLNPQPAYNHVIVSGQSHGVTVSANITGSGGDVSAPMITDNLITYVDAGRERARNVLSNTGRQARVTLDLPLNDTTGLLEPGQFVEVSDTIPWRGLVTGINVTAAYGVVSQSVELERHY